MSFRKEVEQGFELNITSIVDCFTVLITYLLAAASFVSLGMIPAESLVERSESTGAQIAVTQAAPAQLIVEVLQNHKIRFSLWNGNESKKTEFMVSAGENANPEIGMYLTQLHASYPALDRAIMMSDPGVSYGDFIHATEVLNSKSGFKIFLANGEPTK